MLPRHSRRSPLQPPLVVVRTQEACENHLGSCCKRASALRAAVDFCHRHTASVTREVQLNSRAWPVANTLRTPFLCGGSTFSAHALDIAVSSLRAEVRLCNPFIVSMPASSAQPAVLILYGSQTGAAKSIAEVRIVPQRRRSGTASLEDTHSQCFPAHAAQTVHTEALARGHVAVLAPLNDYAKVRPFGDPSCCSSRTTAKQQRVFCCPTPKRNHCVRRWTLHLRPLRL